MLYVLLKYKLISVVKKFSDDGFSSGGDRALFGADFKNAFNVGPFKDVTTDLGCLS